MKRPDELKYSADNSVVVGVTNKDVTYISIPNNVTTIGNGAFRFCSALEIFDIPNSVTRIGEGVFTGCSCLKEIRMHSGTILTNITNQIFGKNINIVIE